MHDGRSGEEKGGKFYESRFANNNLIVNYLTEEYWLCSAQKSIFRFKIQSKTCYPFTLKSTLISSSFPAAVSVF